MGLDLRTVESLAPDQASLQAASKLRQPAKWIQRARDAASDLVWGECQGSGAHPYRVVFDAKDHGNKCTCPSRKFPCKHILALMWLFAENAAVFSPQPVPDWIVEWLGRRRRTGAPAAPAPHPGAAAKSLVTVQIEDRDDAVPVDEQEQAKRDAAARKRAENTHQLILGGLADFEQWVSDQLRLGLAGFLEDHAARCRRIAARLVDGRAATLASRVDELPARLAGLSREERLEAAVVEFSKLIVLCRAYRADPADPAIRASVATAMPRDQVLEHARAERAEGTWEVLAAVSHTQRDGLVRQSTWLMRVAPAPVRFALLLDFVPATAGTRQAGFQAGDQFQARVVYYPAEAPLRAFLEERQPQPPGGRQDWPEWAGESPMSAYLEWLAVQPWGDQHPVTLPAGRVGRTDQGRCWWRMAGDGVSLPLAEAPPLALLGSELTQSVALWDGCRARLVAARTAWGVCHL